MKDLLGRGARLTLRVSQLIIRGRARRNLVCERKQYDEILVPPFSRTRVATYNNHCPEPRSFVALSSSANYRHQIPQSAFPFAAERNFIIRLQETEEREKRCYLGFRNDAKWRRRRREEQTRAPVTREKIEVAETRRGIYTYTPERVTNEKSNRSAYRSRGALVRRHREKTPPSRWIVVVCS